MTADGAYDGEAVYDAVAERHPSATVIIPPRVTSDKAKVTQHDRHLSMIDERGRMAWQRRSGYNHRSLVETAMFRYKTIIGRKLQARTLSNQKTEAKIGCNAQPDGGAQHAGLRLGPPIREPGQETPPAADPCTNAIHSNISLTKFPQVPLLNALMSAFKGRCRNFSSPAVRCSVGKISVKSCRAGDGPAGRRLTCSDARVGCRLSDFRPGLVPVLRRASARSWPPSVAREFPTVDPSPALHDN
jgi:hypothetical protein